MTWILILSFFYQAPAMTWAGDFATQVACEAAGKQWDIQGMQASHKCIQAKRS